MQGKTALIVEENLKDVIKNLGYELYEVEYVKKQNGMNLTLFITHPEHAINISDCELVHKTIDPVLDEIDPTNGKSYYLNVSSIGLDRPIKSDKDYQRNLNLEIIVKQYTDKKEVIGILKSFNEKEIVLDCNGESLVVLRQNIALCKPNVKI